MADSHGRAMTAQRELSISLGIANGSTCALAGRVPMVLSNSLSRHTMARDDTVRAVAALECQKRAERRAVAAKRADDERVAVAQFAAENRREYPATLVWYPTITAHQAVHAFA